MTTKAILGQLVLRFGAKIAGLCFALGLRRSHPVVRLSVRIIELGWSIGRS